MTALIAFYSRADENYFAGEYRYVTVGNTEKAAKMIADATGADLFKIEQKIPYAADYKTCVAQARTDFQSNARPELVSAPKDFDRYTEVFLGYPNYCGTVPMAVLSFIENLSWEGKTIRPFCTHEGSGLANSVRDIESAANGAIVAEGLAILGREVDQAKPQIEAWLAG